MRKIKNSSPEIKVYIFQCWSTDHSDGRILTIPRTRHKASSHGRWIVHNCAWPRTLHTRKVWSMACASCDAAIVPPEATTNILRKKSRKLTTAYTQHLRAIVVALFVSVRTLVMRHARSHFPVGLCVKSAARPRRNNDCFADFLQPRDSFVNFAGKVKHIIRACVNKVHDVYMSYMYFCSALWGRHLRCSHVQVFYTIFYGAHRGGEVVVYIMFVWVFICVSTLYLCVNTFKTRCFVSDNNDNTCGVWLLFHLCCILSLIVVWNAE